MELQMYLQTATGTRFRGRITTLEDMIRIQNDVDKWSDSTRGNSTQSAII